MGSGTSGACILCAVVAALASIALGFYRFNENSYDMALKREMGQAEKLSDHIIQIIQSSRSDVSVFSVSARNLYTEATAPFLMRRWRR